MNYEKILLYSGDLIKKNNLDKVDVIDITAEQNIKINSWINNNKDIVSVDNTFKKVALKITYKEDYYLLYFEFNEKGLVIRVFRGNISLENPIHHFDANTNFNEEYYIDFLNERYNSNELYVDVTYEKYYYETVSDVKNKKELTENTKENVISFVTWYFNILAYSQLNQDLIIKETRTHTKKSQSKKDKRAGKKPKVKLIKQNIIKLNTDHIEPPTEEEKREYERRIAGWTVRGHWREYKSGKRIWIKPQIRGDKEQVEGKVYEID